MVVDRRRLIGIAVVVNCRRLIVIGMEVDCRGLERGADESYADLVLKPGQLSSVISDCNITKLNERNL